MKHAGFRNSIFLIAIGILALSAGLFAYLYSETGTLIDKTLAERNTLKNAQIVRLQGTEVLDLETATASDRSKLASFFVPAEDAVTVIKAIESIGTQSGALVNISSINAAQPDASHIGHVSASVSISGTWRQVMEAIALFETLPYDRTIDQLSMRANGGKEQTWQADFNLSVGSISK